jgi:diguanylate cyclase (GGDEF)-like protein
MPVDNLVDESIKKMFLTIGEHVGIAVENAKLFEQTRTLSLQDPLTGLANRRFMDIMLKRAVQDAKRDGTFSIIMLDIDFFKRFNDTHGHPEGDSLLKKVGYLLSQEIRTTDVAARFGGEEFLVMLPGADRETACSIAERFRSAVENNSPVTISLGVSVYNRDLSESEKELVQRADAALYRAKRAGRNRVESAEK